MKKLLSIMLAAFMVLTLASFSVAADADIQIGTYDELVAWAANGSDDAGKTVVLTADIVANEGDASGYKDSAPSNVWANKDFAGTFDGQGHSISGLYTSGAGSLGFIKNLSGTVQNVSIVNSAFLGTGSVNGGVVANIKGVSTVENCYSDAIVTGGNHCGGIVGNQGADVTITGCWFDGEVTLTATYASGILGNQQSKKATITDCLNTGKVTGTGNLAGISNAVYAGTLNATRCVTTGAITGTGSAVADVVGATGAATFVDCYAQTGSVGVIQVRDARSNAESSAAITGTVGEIAALNDLASNAAFAETWALNGDGKFVPKAFAKANDDTIVISTADELIAWAADADANEGKTVILATDVTLTADWTPKAEFKGVFDGQGNKIIGLKGAQGLVTKATNAEFNGLSIVDATITTEAGNVGAFAGTAIGCTFVDCYTNVVATSTTNNIGGFVGQTATAANTFTGCWFDGDVHSEQRYISGFIGNNQSQNSTFTDCLSTGNVSAVPDNAIIAAFAGAIYGGVMEATNCLVSAGTLTAPVGAAFAYRDNDASDAKYVNCYAIEGFAPKLDVETNADSKPGQVEWISADAITVELMGENWGLDADDRVVPKAFEDTSRVIIKTWDELVAWAAATDNNTSNVALAADITAPSDAAWTPKGNFGATFDGKGHSISGLKGAQGLVANAAGATFTDLSIIDSTITTDKGAVAIFVGKATGDITFTKCYTNATATSTTNNIGGFVGDGASSATLTFNMCWFDGDVHSDARYISGYVGNNESCAVIFTDCLSTGKVSAVPENAIIAAFAGAIYNGKIEATNCLVGGGSLTAPVGAAFAFRDNDASDAKFVNCYAIEGFAPKLDVETNADSKAGQVEWIKAEDITAAKMGENWGVTEEGTVVPICFGKASEEPGEEPDDFDGITITNWDELVAWAQSQDTTTDVRLAGDINAPEGDAANWTPKASFSGTFDGQGFAIAGMKTNGAETAFIHTTVGATIKNVYFKGCTFTSPGGHVATVAVNSAGSTFENIYSDAIVTATAPSAGGLIVHGVKSDAVEDVTNTFISCWFDGELDMGEGQYGSGIFGNQESNPAVFTDCLNTGKIKAKTNIAGISTAVYDGSAVVTRCVNLGEVKNTEDKLMEGIIRTVTHRNDTAVGTAELVDCYNLKDKAVSQPSDVRDGATLTGTVTEVASLDDMSVFSALKDNWKVFDWKGAKIIVPNYFADNDGEDIPEPAPTTAAPSTAAPSTAAPTAAPTTAAPTAAPSTAAPTEAPSTAAPTEAPTTAAPTEAPATAAPTEAPASATASQAPASQAPVTADGVTVFVIVALILSAGAFVVVSKARARV